MAKSYLSLPLSFNETHQQKLFSLHEELMLRLGRGKGLNTSFLSEIQIALKEAIYACMDWERIKIKIASNTILHLIHHENHILNLPWQLAFMEWEGILITKGYSSFTYNETFTSKTPLPLRVLVMISSPEDSLLEHRLSYEQEEDLIIAAFEPLYQIENIEIDFTDDGSIEALERKLSNTPYHILHFSGHGTFKNNRGYLALEDSLTSNQKLVDEDLLANVFKKHQHNAPDLIILSSCKTAQGSASWGFEGIAGKLLKIGIPSVIAMAHNILDSYANIFAASFYTGLSKRFTVPEAFSFAINQLKVEEAQKNTPSQWVIPQLYCHSPIQNIVNWMELSTHLFSSGDKVLSNTVKVNLKHYFIGRRKERGQSINGILQNRVVILRGQGGVGKTRLSRDIIRRLSLSYPSLVIFEFNEKTASLSRFIRSIEDHIARKGITITDLIANEDNAIGRFKSFLNILSEEGKPYLFFFDNVETFQDGKAGSAFRKEHKELEAIIKLLSAQSLLPTLLTGRYDLPADITSNAIIIPVNQVRYNEVFLKCRQLVFGQLERALSKKAYPGEDKITFRHIVDILYGTLGGNYLALEIFDELYQCRRSEIINVCKDLEALKRKMASLGGAAIAEMSQILVFNELLNELDDSEKELLTILSAFRTPILSEGVTSQVKGHNVELSLSKLENLTLVEVQKKHINGTRFSFYYVTPVIKDLIKNSKLEQPEINHLSAGSYYEKAIEFTDNYLDLEEAYHHYFISGEKEKINTTGTMLCIYYFEEQLFEKSKHYGEKTRGLLGTLSHINTLNYLSFIANIRGESESALALLTEVMEKHKEDNDIQGQARTLNNISDIYIKKGEFHKSIEFSKKCLKLSLEINDKESQASSYSTMGLSFYYLGKSSNAEENLKKSLRLFKSINNPFSEATVLSNLSLTMISLGDFEEGYSFALQGLEIRQRIRDQKGEGESLNNIGSIFLHVGQLDEALYYFEQALNIQRILGLKKEEGLCLNNIQTIYYRKGLIEGDSNNKRRLFAKALNYVDKALSIFTEIGLQYEIATTLNNIATIKLAQGDTKEVLSTLLECKAIRENINDTPGLIVTLFNIACVKAQEEDWPSFFDYAILSFEKGLAINNIPHVMMIGQELAHAYVYTGQGNLAIPILLQLKEIAIQIDHPDLNKINQTLNELL